MFAAFVTMLLFSVSAICGHRSAKLLGGTEANFWRITFATTVLAIWAYAFGQGLSGVGVSLFLCSGLLGIGLGDVAYFQSLPRLGPRLTLLLVQCLTAPIGALVEWVWLGTTLSPQQALFGLTILVGVGIALAPSEHVHLKRRDLVMGVMAGVIAAIGGAGGAVFSRKAYAVIQAAGEHIDPVSAGFQRVLGGWFLSGICLLMVKWNAGRAGSAMSGSSSSGFSLERLRRAWGWIVLNSLAGQTLGVSCMQWALETTPAGIVLPIIAMSPIAVIPMAFLIEGERPSVRSLAGGFVAVGGVIGLTLSR